MFVIRAWKVDGRLSGRDRWALSTSFAVAATTFVVAPLLVNWVRVPTLIWLIAVALLAGGVVGAVLRWPELAWFSGTRPIRHAIRVSTTLVSCALIIGVAVI
ncbi:MAG TPA: hypothetical protein VIM84_07280 [Gemmatimonadales bacterium]